MNKEEYIKQRIIAMTIDNIGRAEGIRAERARRKAKKAAPRQT